MELFGMTLKCNGNIIGASLYPTVPLIIPICKIFVVNNDLTKCTGSNGDSEGYFNQF
jgi:hypothetical protein